MKINESILKQIIDESVKKVLKESFNDKKLSIEIERHGGIDNKHNDLSASYNSNFDLQNAIYGGYLSRTALQELMGTSLMEYIKGFILFTQDGGAIVVDERISSMNDMHAWNEKVKKRNQNWGESGQNQDDFKGDGYRKERIGYEWTKPKDFNTYARRSDNKRK